MCEREFSKFTNISTFGPPIKKEVVQHIRYLSYFETLNFSLTWKLSGGLQEAMPYWHLTTFLPFPILQILPNDLKTENCAYTFANLIVIILHTHRVIQLLGLYIT